MLQFALIALLFGFSSGQTCTNGDIRLANGVTESQGRVEVCVGEQWGTVTDDGWTALEAKVVCRQLGYSDRFVLSWKFAYFGQGTGMPILLDNLRCTGTEDRLIDCPYSTPSTSTDNHGEDAGVSCYPINDNTGVCTTGDFRLRDGGNNLQGRLEVCMGGLWGTVADDGWGTPDAKVLCRQLGFVDKFGLPTHFGRPFGQGTGHIWLDGLGCSGTEENLFDCNFEGAQIDTHSEDSGVRCFDKISYPNCDLGELRLVAGTNGREGRVEICLNGTWGTIADDGWSTGDAKTACRQLGFAAYGAMPCSNACFGQGTGPIWLDSTNCNGREDQLINCGYMTGSTDLDFHWEDAGLTCNEADCIEGVVRIVNGSIPAEGRVELCFEGRWTSVCDKGWTKQDAQVVCSQLGYGADHAYPYISSYFGGNTALPILIDDIRCSGSEATLISCSYSTYIQSSTCSSTHIDDAGVRCVTGSECMNGAVRLVGGTQAYEGRLEVCIDGLWGTVTDDSFQVHDAAVVCKQLGYYPNYGHIFSGAYFGEGNGIIHMDNVICFGSEDTIFNCTYRAPDHYDQHNEDVGVRCIPEGDCTTGMVRLMGGSNTMEGRVEVCIQGVWGTVTDDLWSGLNAQVVCKQLGFADGYGLPYGNAAFGQGSGAVAMDNVVCNGDETVLTDCTYQVPYFDYHSEDAGVRCFPNSGSPCTNGQLRLVNGANNREGRVEVCYDGQWGTICRNYWTTVDANVACKELGFAGAGATAFINADFGQGTGPIWLTETSCDGDEDNIVDCRIDANTGYCSHSMDAGLRCLSTECTNGDVRLVGGSVEQEGRVEVCRNGLWGTVCDNQWGVDDAKVVCKQLGYSNETVFAYSEASFGAGIDWIWLTNSNCTGQENKLVDCMFSSNTAICDHSEDAAVKCIAGNNCTHGELRLVGGDDCDEGLVEVCLNGHWGSVANDGWDTSEATVVCRQLGYLGIVGAPVSGTQFARGTGQIAMAKLACTGRESQLVNCPFKADTSAYTHNNDAGVKCFQSQSCANGALRLSGGSSMSSGRVEVCLGGKWGTVSNTDWDNNAVKIICRQLGYLAGSMAQNTYTACAPIYLHSLKCQGNENGWRECVLNTDTSEDSHANDVAVMCSNRVPPSSSVATSPSIIIPTAQRLTISTTSYIVGVAIIGGALVLIIIVLIIAVLVVRARRNRVEIPVDKQNIVVSASFPKDSASPVDVLNQAYDDTANEDDIDLGEEKGVLDEVEKK